MNKLAFAVSVSALLWVVLPSSAHHDGGGGDFCAPPGASKVLTLIVPFAPGGSTDMAARAIGTALSHTTNRPVVVDNKAGAGGMVGVQHLLSLPRNGCQLLISNYSPVVLMPAIGVAGAAERVRDLVPVAQLGEMPYVLVTARSDIRDVSALRQVAASRSLTYASSGNGSVSHLAGAALNGALGGKMTHVPYKGSGPQITDLLGGQVDVGWIDAGQAAANMRAGRLQALVVSGRSRLPDLPGVPTAQEAKLDDADFVDSIGVYGPRGVVEVHADQIARALQQAASDIHFRAGMAKIGMRPTGLGPADFAAALKANSDRWARVARTYGIKGD